jgi:hypothetical protein
MANNLKQFLDGSKRKKSPETNRVASRLSQSKKDLA